MFLLPSQSPSVKPVALKHMFWDESLLGYQGQRVKRTVSDWKDIGVVLPAKPRLFFSMDHETNCIITTCISIVWFFPLQWSWNTVSNTFSSPTPIYIRFWLGRIITHIWFIYTHIYRYIIRVLCVTCVLMYLSCICLWCFLVFKRRSH